MRIATLALVAAIAGGCRLAENYDEPAGPRYAGDHTGGVTPAPSDQLRVVTYNLRYAIEIDTAIVALRNPELANADVILMQELDANGADRIAAALNLRYVYYPASINALGTDFGPAILTSHRIAADRKLILPHRDPINGRLRNAVAADLDIAGRSLRVYSVHTSIITLGLGDRLEQVAALIDDAARVEGPALVGGDFNTGDPGSADQTVELFEDHAWTWSTAGTDDTGDGAGASWLLDFVFTRGLRARSAGVFRGDTGSDHRPVWAVVDAP